MPNFDQFSFILGIIVALVARWILARIWDWITGIFKPPSGVPLGQKISGGLRKLLSALLVLTALLLVGYIIYTVLLK